MLKKGVAIVAITIIAVIFGVVVYYKYLTPEEVLPPSDESEFKSLSLTSTTFKNGEKIPQKYTCDGENLSPPLSWSEIPEDTKCFALIMDDPDAPNGVFTHWVLFNLPVEIVSLPEGVPKSEYLENGGIQGMNDFGEIGYGGPCPPKGNTHNYRFHLYAINKHLDLEAGASKQDLLEALEGNIVDEAEITGVYSR